MHRLSGEDAGFLVMERPEQPMNTQAVGILSLRRDADGTPRPFTIDDLRAHLAARLDDLPSFRWRIVPVPFGLHQPVAVRDPLFDLDAHLRTATVDAPGGPAELDALFAALAERHLDRRHPLWQCTLVSGLAGDRQAIILKYHHCLADGVGAHTTFARVFSDLPVEPLPGEPRPWRAEEIPSRTRLVLDALRDHLRGARRVPGLARRTRRGTAAAKARRASAAVATPGFDGEAPWTLLNDAGTVARAYCRVAIPLADAKAVKDAAGVTLNDVALAVVAGGVRTYLADRDALPDRPLLASVPVSSEPPDAPVRQAGNRFWSFTTSLATDIADPVERLTAISAVAREARGQLEVLGADLMPAWLDLVPPAVAAPGADALFRRVTEQREHADANVLVSNIRGPAEPWPWHGSIVEELWIDGPPSNGVGANVMLWSYGDRLLFGILCFADAVTDPPALAAACEAAFAELRAAVSG